MSEPLQIEKINQKPDFGIQAGTGLLYLDQAQIICRKIDQTVW